MILIRCGSVPIIDPAVCWTGTNNGAVDIIYAESISQVCWLERNFSGNTVGRRSYGNDLSPAACQRILRVPKHRLTPSTNSPDYNIDGSFGGPVPIIGAALGDLRFFTSFIMNREMLLIPLSRPDYKDYNWSHQVEFGYRQQN